ncbi:MAG: CRTAC1 family protein [Planctomycetota bacterium]
MAAVRRGRRLPAWLGLRHGLVVLLALAGACGGEDPGRKPAPNAAPAPPFRFVDVAATAGLTAPTWCGSVAKPHLMESGGPGLAVLDYDGDGHLDVYLVNGWRTDGTRVLTRGANVLYRNRGDATFEDVTDRAGVGDPGWGNGVAVADVDGDGDLDLFVSNFGPDVLYLNQGDGTFALHPDPPSIDGWSAGAAFFDADGDGDLDLFLAGYIDCTLEDVLQAQPTLDWKEAKVAPGPFGLEGKGNRYFENLGGGRFEDATKRAGLTDVGLYYSFGVLAVDIDGDLDVDLYVANDSNPNYLYRNDGKGKFREVGLWSGAALDANGAAQAGMGLAAADYDADGDPDLFVTNFAQDSSTLYRNDGNCIFEDVSKRSGVRGPTYAALSWGPSFSDFDLDGDLDLYVANGHSYPQADTAPRSETTYRQRNLLLANDGGRFTDVSTRAGPGLKIVESSRGVAVGDMDRDGDLDLVVSNVDEPPNLLRNDTVRRGAWLLVDAPGALRVGVEAGDLRLVRHHVVAASFLSAGDPRFHFGLGPVTTVSKVTALWPDGTRKVLRDVAVNRVVKMSR